MPSAIRSKARRALSHAGRTLSAGSKIPAGRWFWSLSTGATSTDPRTQRMRFPQRRLHSSAGFYRTEPDPTHPVPQRPTRRALPPPVVRAKTLLQHPRASSHYVALVYVASDGAEHLDQPTDLPDGYHKSSALDPDGV